MIKPKGNYWNQLRTKTAKLMSHEGVKKYETLQFVNSAVNGLRIEENEGNEVHMVIWKFP